MSVASSVDPLADFPDYLAALLQGNRSRCRELYLGWIEAGIDLRRLYEEVVQRSLYEVGARWEANLLTVAHEHLATAITESLLPLSYPRLFATRRNGRSAVVACAENEWHQIGGKLVADVFELHGWRGHFLGANTPGAELAALVRERRPEVVALSLTLPANQEALVRLVARLRTEFPLLPILVGGQAWRAGGTERLEPYPRVQYLPSLAALESWLEDAGNHGH